MANWVKQEKDSVWLESYRIWIGGCQVWKQGEGEEAHYLSQKRGDCLLPKLQPTQYHCRHLPS